MEAADTSSTDSDSSDWDVEKYKSYNDSLLNDSATSSTDYRVLPTWASSSVPSDTGTKHENQLLQEDTKRTLQCSLQPSSCSHVPSFVVKDAADSSQIHESNEKSCSSASSGHAKPENFSGVVMKNDHGSRILPLSMKAPMSVPTTQSAGQSDPSRPRVVQETVGDEMLIYQAVIQDLCQPITEATLPDGLLTVSLLKHQKIALAWMIQKENSVACSGGILADDQGLGKTISSIALIQMQKFLSKSKSEDPCISKEEAFELDDDNDNGTSIVDEDKQAGESDKGNSSRSSQKSSNRRPQAGSLVVCPASVLRQWHREFRDKVSYKSKLKVLIYHGSTRTKDPAVLAKYDVVLTTYAIVANEIPTKTSDDGGDDDNQDNGDIRKKRKQSHVGNKGTKGRKGSSSSSGDRSGTLGKVHWFRVILDEAQTIKNKSTRVAKSCCGLRAKKRWCLSGTPIQNSIDDLFSYFRFLKCEPYANYKSFCHQIKIPISKNSVQGYSKLQAVLRAIMLRRTKDTMVGGKPIIDLPPKTINLTKLDFSTEERAFYLKLEAESRSRFKAYAAAGTVSQNYANIMLMLLRLRQACNHPLLVKGFSSESISRDSTKMAKNLPIDLQVNLLNLLETLNICLFCNDPPDDAVVTLCGHVFCYQCVAEYLTGDDNTCPSPNCKSQIGSDVVFNKATLKSCISNDDHQDSPKIDEGSMVLQYDYNSSKIRATLDIIHSHISSQYANSSARPIKTIVFSQWTRMLDLVEMPLNLHCIQYRRLDGSMSLVARDRAVKEFNTDPEVIVMLMSLKAGNLGLNMVAASHVILLDLWWNPATEDQAVDRAHRIGQTRPVTVSKLTIKDTVEDRILALQEEKRKMVASAFGEDKSGSSASRLTAEDLKYLFMGVF